MRLKKYVTNTVIKTKRNKTSKKEQKKDENYYTACQTVFVRFVFTVVLQSVFVIVICPANSTNHTQDYTTVKNNTMYFGI